MRRPSGNRKVCTLLWNSNMTLCLQDRTRDHCTVLAAVGIVETVSKANTLPPLLVSPKNTGFLALSSHGKNSP